MKILSVSTATNHLSVAINEGSKVLVEANEEDQRNHSEHLDPLIDQLLKKEQLKLADIDRFAVAIGPGSYTGLRIGITTIKMFASILGKKCAGISTLAALAANVEDQDKIVVSLIDARNDNFFAGAYLNGENVIADGHYAFDRLLAAIKQVEADRKLPLVFVGSGLDKIKDRLDQSKLDYEFGQAEQNQPHAGVIGRLAEHIEPVDPDQLLPRYLRRTQAEVDWHKKTGQPYGPDSAYVEEV